MFTRNVQSYWTVLTGSLEPAPNSAALSPVKSQRMELATNPGPVVTSEKPLGRKGRLANLAATIGSWEEDLRNPPTHRDNPQGQPGTACVPPPARVGMSTSVKPIAAAQQAASVQPVASKPVHSTQQVGHTLHFHRAWKKFLLLLLFLNQMLITFHVWYVLASSLFSSQIIQSDSSKSPED